MSIIGTPLHPLNKEHQLQILKLINFYTYLIPHENKVLTLQTFGRFWYSYNNCDTL